MALVLRLAVPPRPLALSLRALALVPHPHAFFLVSMPNLVLALVETAVAEHLPDLHVRVHQILKTVVVAAKTLLQHAHHQDRPDIHPRPAGVAAPVRKNALVQKSEQLVARRLVLVDRLQAIRNAGMSFRNFAFSLITSIGIDPRGRRNSMNVRMQIPPKIHP